jgi:phospholipase/carboxylesterase
MEGTSMTTASHTHLFIAGTDPIRPPLILLHGSGGNEDELVALAADVAPGSPTLSIRGTVSIDGGFAFFRRSEDGTIDEAVIAARASPLADFLEAASARYSFTGAPIAIGFSNGAIMVAHLLLTRPGVLAGAILFRPLSPFQHDLPTRLDGPPVLIIDGEKDSRRSPGDGARLADRLARAGAIDSHHVLPVGHSITAMDREIAREWLTGR